MSAVTSGPAAYFSDDYRAARAAFLSACAAAGAAVESHENPHPGPDGAPMFTDACSLGPAAGEAALLLGSGTHGVEGFAGSAIQTGLLREGIGSRLPARVRLVMIHAINPYGFAHLRRANEDNVDLNRNCVDHAAAPPANPEYDRLAGTIAPARWSAPARAATLGQLLAFRLRRGERALQAAISRGQYAHPQGLFYGGRFETWSVRTFRAVAGHHLAGAARVAFVDLHTGLGPYGHGEIIVGEPRGSPAHRRALAWWGDRVQSRTAGESVSPDLEGTLDRALARALPAAEVTAAGLEFGTYPPMAVFLAMRAENWLHHHGGPDHPRAAPIKARFREMFYPADPGWKAKVWTQGETVVAQALAGLGT